jgi:predicted HicB family RNase H-like nuclease
VANLTLTIDDEVLKKARIHALERGTSVNALVREYLEQLRCIGGSRSPFGTP